MEISVSEVETKVEKRMGAPSLISVLSWNGAVAASPLRE